MFGTSLGVDLSNGRGVPLVCVDITSAVTKLADRGSVQATGIVTDIGLFLEQLVTTLCPPPHP